MRAAQLISLFLLLIFVSTAFFVTEGDGENRRDKVGSFIISLDCELYWGVRDKRRLDEYRENLIGDRQVVPRLLSLFDTYGIHATWAFVGFLFFSDRRALLESLPAHLPSYRNPCYSPYRELDSVGENETEDPFHFGSELITEVLRHPGQEIASHTFSHFYCLEEGQTADEFREDLEANVRAAQRYGVDLKSIVFPRNQVNTDYLAICQELGIRAYRGNTPDWLYREMNEEQESRYRRALRYVDAFVPITGQRVTALSGKPERNSCNIRASRFLYPQYRWSTPFDVLRLARIKREMTAAARSGSCYHLWWHPHNFGVEQDANLDFLRRILDHFERLHQACGFTSRNMNEMADLVLGAA
jgi:peptidoglycan/xylan/chitin deacetylase (PgdA/CDA1 family)